MAARGVQKCLMKIKADPVATVELMLLLTVSLVAMAATLGVLGGERQVYEREASEGLSTLAYFASKVSVPSSQHQQPPLPSSHMPLTDINRGNKIAP